MGCVESTPIVEPRQNNAQNNKYYPPPNNKYNSSPNNNYNSSSNNAPLPCAPPQQQYYSNQQQYYPNQQQYYPNQQQYYPNQQQYYPNQQQYYQQQQYYPQQQNNQMLGTAAAVVGGILVADAISDIF